MISHLRMQMSRQGRLLILATIVAIGFGFRAYGLSAAGLSEDEVNKVDAARAYLAGDFSKNLEHPMLMKLGIAASLVATDAWNARFADTVQIPEEVPVRLPNVIFGSLTTIVMFLFAECLFGTQVALLAAAFWATGGLAITINRIAKEDTLVVFFFWQCLYFYERAKRSGANHAPAPIWFYGLSGASLGLMLASKYFPQYWALLFLYYHLAGKDGTDPPLTRADYVAFYGCFVGFFLAFNPTVLHPATLAYFVGYAREETVTHHGYVVMGELYANNVSATPFGLPVYFYPLLLGLKTPLPVLAAMVGGLVVAARRWQDRGNLFLVLMFVLWIVPYSLFASKWLRYVISLMPVLYVCAAVGLVATLRFASRRWSRPSQRMLRAAFAIGMALVFVVIPAVSTARSGPIYSLYLNSLGMGRVGYYFPHDEFYDAGLREAIEVVCRDAPPNAVVYGEAPPVFRYYQRRFGREDLRYSQLSDLSHVRQADPPEFVIVQDGRRYFENAPYLDTLAASRQPYATIEIDGAVAARVYRMADGEWVSDEAIVSLDRCGMIPVGIATCGSKRGRANRYEREGAGVLCRRCASRRRV